MADIAGLVDRVQRVAVRGPRVTYVLEVTGTLECPRVGGVWQPWQPVVAWLEDWRPGRDACAVVLVVATRTPAGTRWLQVAGCDRAGNVAEAFVEAGRVSLCCSRSAFACWLRAVWPVAGDPWTEELVEMTREE